MIRGHVSCHYGPGAHNSAVSYRHTFEYNGPRSDKRATPDLHWARARAAERRFFAPFPLACRHVKIVVDDHRARAEDCAFANFNRGGGTQHRPAQTDAATE